MNKDNAAEFLLDLSFDLGDNAGFLLDYIYNTRPEGFSRIVSNSAYGVGIVDGFTIKRVDKEAVPQFKADSQVDSLNIAPLVLTACLESYAYIVNEFIPGPTLASKLESSPEDRYRLLRKNLDDLVVWQKDYPSLSEQDTPEEVHEYYMSNLRQIMRDPSFHDAIHVFESLKIPYVVRTLDNSPHNSGFKADHEDVDRLEKEYFYWDMARKFSHELEDFFAIYDSFEAHQEPLNLECDLLKKYASGRGRDFEPSEIILVGLYRNLRKNHLIRTHYTALIESEHQQNTLTKKEKDSLLQDYTLRAEHHLSRASHYAGLGALSSEFDLSSKKSFSYLSNIFKG
ncbi:MAG: hypothetical protein ACLFP2_05395 [Candidatus Woesearchaeota archaeon]